MIHLRWFMTVCVLASPLTERVAAQSNPATLTPRVVLGTTQLDGMPAHLGETFTVGKASPLNFTLTSAEYRLDRITMGKATYFPTVGEKLLVLHFTVHNPQKTDVRYYWADFTFTAVDAQDRNHVFVQAVMREGTSERLEITLKPAQKVQVMTVIRVPAHGPVPKLLVQRESAVLRYDLHGQVTRLTAAQSDPADPEGTSATPRVESQPLHFDPLEAFDVRFDEAHFTQEALNGRLPKAGFRYFTAVFTVRNPTPNAQTFAWSTFKLTLKDVDGERTDAGTVMLKANRDERAGGTLPGGEDARVRFVFEVPVGVGMDRLSITDAGGRAYVYRVQETE